VNVPIPGALQRITSLALRSTVGRYAPSSCSAVSWIAEMVSVQDASQGPVYTLPRPLEALYALYPAP